MKVGVIQTHRCEGCGEEFERENKPGRSPKWCSQRCRKRTLYGGTCEECGATTNGYDGPGTAASRCESCVRASLEEHREAVFAAWNEGELTERIAERFGFPTTDAVYSLVDWHRRVEGRDDLVQRWRTRRSAWPEVERRWNAGGTATEIAAALDTNAPNIHEMLKSMRQAGIDVPRRPGA